jgi:hypothetical protein
MAAGAQSEADPLAQATAVVDRASAEGVPLRLIGGLAVRALCPDFPPRVRDDQDLDLASVSSASGELDSCLAECGFEADRAFNALHGRKQLRFEGRGELPDADVVLDRVDMCHSLDFRKRLDRMPQTLDVTDLLLSKLQIVELNEKDLQDIVYLLAAFEVREGDEPGTIALDRIGEVVGDDWGWWRTVTRNLDLIAAGSGDSLAPPSPPRDPAEQATRLREHADAVPKSVRWRLRSKVGERVRWYELPEEVGQA